MKFGNGLEALGTGEYPEDGRIDNRVFESSAVEHVELPLTLKRIEHCAFRGCLLLKSIELPEKLEYIGKHCF